MWRWKPLNDQDRMLAQQVALMVASKWSLVDVQDVEAELFLWLVENEHHVDAYRVNDDVGKLVVALKRHAIAFCVKEQTIRQGGALMETSDYSAEQVERVLPFVYLDTPQTIVNEFEKHHGDHSLSLAIMADVKSALIALPEDMKETLTQRFYLKLTFQEMGDIAGITKRAAKKRVDRAILELRRNLTRSQPGSISN